MSQALRPGERVCLPASVLARMRAGCALARAIPSPADEPGGAGLHLAVLEAGAVALALPAPLTIELVAIEAIELELLDIADEAGVLGALADWIRTVEHVGAWTPPAAPRALFTGRTPIDAGEIVAAPRDGLAWLRDGEGWRALSDGAPIRWGAAAIVEVADTPGLLRRGALPAALVGWADATATRLATLLAQAAADRQARLRDADEAAQLAGAGARAALAGRPPPQRAGDRVSAARAALALAMPGLPDPPAEPVPDAPEEALAAGRATALEAGLGVREVALAPGWQRADGPPLLLELPDGQPGAARAEAGRYVPRRPDGTQAAAMPAPRGLALAAPPDAAMVRALRSAGGMLGWAWRVGAHDAVSAIAWGVAGLLLAAATPVAVDLLFSAIWPRADAGGHAMVIAGLAAAALGMAGVEAARSARASRALLRLLDRLESGTWLGLVRATPQALAGRSAGDIQRRLAGALGLQQTLFGQPMRLVVDLAGMAASLGLMIYYGGHLAWIGVAATVACLLASALLLPAIGARLAAEEMAGAQAALVSQAIAAIAKVKATASEPFLLARWAGMAARHRAASRRAAGFEAAATVATSGLQGMAGAALFGFAGAMLASPAGSGAAPLDLGAFLAFQTSLGQLVAAALSAAGAIALLPRLRASARRLAPLAGLPADADLARRRRKVPALDGRIGIARVTHRYPGSPAPSLDGIEIEIAARDYVAIVGASGSGKSTLLRLVLGLEQPEAGAIYFDGLDARLLDPEQLRRQIGHVGQDARLAPGSILDNILDGRVEEMQAAWEAARLAGLAEEIEAMPMGMHTLVGEAGQNLSGGQRQRVLIARALLTRPRILVFDEATSALDNRVQAVVQQGLATMPVTRIVVAHRLSTVMGVDRVFVLDRGRLVESGPPAELLRRGGRFAALAGRQLLEAES